MKKNNFSPIAIVLFYFLIHTQLIAQRDVYLVIGQSNAAGRALIEAQDMVTLSGVDLFNGTTWEPCVNENGEDGGLNRYSTVKKDGPDQGLNFAYTFGRTINEVTGNQIGLVVNAIGGTNINAWAKGASENYYGEAINQVNAALALGDSTLRGILWHQGEANRNDSNYLTKVDNLIKDLRTDLGVEDLSFIAGQLSKQRIENDFFNTNIKKLSNQLDPAYVPYTDYASSVGLITDDRTHFISNAQRVLGYRYAAKVLEMVYGYTYVKDQIVYIDEDAYVRAGTHANTVQQTGAENELVRIKETSTNVNNVRRGLLKFDISSLTETEGRLIIDTSLIINADLDDDDGNDNDEPMDINFYDIDNNWSESTVTFNNAPRFSNLISSSFSSFYIDGLHQRGADITEYFKDQYDLGRATISLGLKSETDGTPQLKISTKDDASNFSLRPHLLVSYIETSTLSNTNPLNQLDTLKIAFTNPVENELIINSNFNISEVTIYSLTGKHLKNQTVNNSSSSKINTSNLLSGTYILSVKVNTKNTYKLLVKK